MSEASLLMAKEYLNIFRRAPASTMASVVRVQERNVDTAKQTARNLRLISAIGEEKPMINLKARLN